MKDLQNRVIDNEFCMECPGVSIYVQIMFLSLSLTFLFSLSLCIVAYGLEKPRAFASKEATDMTVHFSQYVNQLRLYEFRISLMPIEVISNICPLNAKYIKTIV